MESFLDRGIGRSLVAGLVGLLLGGCSLLGGWDEDPLEEVARDWMRVIRASQVIPIYPLTEDLQPGDVFLVQTPIEKQQSIWNEREGYLPLDYHVARLDPGGYPDFYDHFFEPGDPFPILPRDWRAAAGSEVSSSWGEAPGASFPSYGFSVDRAGGLNLAVPVSSVPIGLSLLGGDAVQGSLSLGKARTLGVDISSIYGELLAWGDSQRAFLAAFGPQDGGPPENYLRLITRIYLVGKIDVSMQTDASRGAGLDLGAPRPVELVVPDRGADPGGATAQDYRSNLRILNEGLAGAGSGLLEGVAPGASVRITACSSRSISLAEDFDPPLVVGYLGFDVPILTNGELGLPIPTHSLLERNASAEARRLDASDPVQAVHADLAIHSAYEVLLSRADDGRARDRIAALDGLREHVPGETSLFASTLEGLAETRRGSADYAPGLPGFQEYHGQLEASVRSLGRALERGSFEYLDADGLRRAVDPDSGEYERLVGRFYRQQELLDRETTALYRSGRAAVGYFSTLIGG